MLEDPGESSVSSKLAGVGPFAATSVAFGLSGLSNRVAFQTN